MHLAHAHPAAGAEQVAASLTGLMSHIDTVYGFALALAGDADSAAELTERVYDGAPHDLWSTLGDDSLRGRLLARCFAIFTEELGRRELTRTFHSIVPPTAGSVP